MRHVLLLSAFLALSVVGSVGAETAGPKYLSYEEFLEKVRAEEVKSLTIKPLHYLEGSYLDGDQEVPFFTGRPLEAQSDPLLMELLGQHEVKVVNEPQPEPDIMAQLAQYGPFILVLALPSALGVIVLVYLVRLNKKIDRVIKGQ